MRVPDTIKVGDTAIVYRFGDQGKFSAVVTFVSRTTPRQITVGWHRHIVSFNDDGFSLLGHYELREVIRE